MIHFQILFSKTQYFDWRRNVSPIFLAQWLSVRERELHDTIQMKSNFGTNFSSIYLAKEEKRLVFRLSFVNLQRAKDGTHMFDATYRYVFVV